ncbi:efflux RND transporter periplasmic adaptor subunit [Massilia sp. YMA4]|uniref:efflux RND transporter periplasmic adaptor subunit n=1 Tax=Massilia sp. YMA4 TaxID=1593482 RepID=UPI000DD128D7|nr:HlyD family efflux transporter periplasmic adaptor subunit [Massilia sp. YMA4]AXA92887.1 efflux transporter periplasmic adaptor subunit [Massilia sp. YMA4]
MNAPRESIDITGAGMDVPRARPHHRWRPWGAAAAACALLLALGWSLAPRGMRVAADSVRVATVQRGVLTDDVVVRANAEALNQVLLDAVESGRVEEVYVRDGAQVRKGDLLFRLSNAQRRMELLQRESEQAQQLSNLANLQVTFQVARNQHDDRVDDLRFDVTQADKLYRRNRELAAKGFISAVALDESADKLEQARQKLRTQQRGGTSEFAVRAQAMNTMAGAIRRLESGMQLAHATIDGLAMRAPASGRLADFDLQVGQAVRTDQRVGRIDDAQFKLMAQIDEYYLNRVAPGRRGVATIDGRDYPVAVSRVYRQVKERRFSAELLFERQPPALQPGMSVDVRLTLGEPRQALVLPAGAYLNDSGGAWVYALAADGRVASRRAVQTGRRNASQVEVLGGLAAGERVIVSAYAPYGQAERLRLEH